tara:strand:+ start:485 stop:673 length:189 start_codon:yes stop_codon:yes gene_type:complete
MKRLLEELKFQIDMLEQDTIDKDDFVNAITEIREHYNQLQYTLLNPEYSKHGIEMVEWFKKS